MLTPIKIILAILLAINALFFVYYVIPSNTPKNDDYAFICFLLNIVFGLMLLPLAQYL